MYILLDRELKSLPFKAKMNIIQKNGEWSNSKEKINYKKQINLRINSLQMIN